MEEIDGDAPAQQGATTSRWHFRKHPAAFFCLGS